MRFFVAMAVFIGVCASCGTTTGGKDGGTHGACECGDPNADPCETPPPCTDACGDVVFGTCGSFGTWTCTQQGETGLCATASTCNQVAIVDGQTVTCEQSPASCTSRATCACVDPTAFGCAADSPCTSVAADAGRVSGPFVIIQCNPSDAGASDAKAD